MNNADVPIWEKYTLTIEEASKYFSIGEKGGGGAARPLPWRCHLVIWKDRVMGAAW